MLALLLVFVVVSVSVPAQDGTAADAGLVLIPPTVYVGDRARLVIPVTPLEGGEIAGGKTAQVIEVAERLPRSKDVTVHRLELEIRGSEGHILADFSAYAPGMVDFPRLEFGPYSIPGFQLRIASILAAEDASPLLSPPLDALSPPGTALLLYGTVIAAFLVLLLLVGGTVWGIPALRAYAQRRRRRLAWRTFRRVLAELGKTLAGDPAPVPAPLLSRLGAALRTYLGERSGVSCLALSPREFRTLDPFLPGSDDGAYLEGFFRRCDELRFGHEPPVQGELDRLLASVEEFALALERASAAVPGSGS